MNLRSLQNYHQQVEEGVRAELFGLQRQRYELQAQRAQVESAADMDAERYVSDAQAGMAPDDAMGRYGEFFTMMLRIEQIDQDISQLEAQVFEKQSAVVEAAQERKKIDLLVARQEKRTQAEENRKEQIGLDETGVLRFLRGTASTRSGAE